MVKGRSSPSNCQHPRGFLHFILHCDVFVIIEVEGSFGWFEYIVDRTRECKHITWGPNHENSARVFNRHLNWNKDDISYEIDWRRAELAIQHCKIDGEMHVVTPGIREMQCHVAGIVPNPMDPERARAYRMSATQFKHLVVDRPDIQHATKEVAKHMSDPLVHHWQMLPTVGRYTKGVPRFVQAFKWMSRFIDINGCSDFDWVGDRMRRRSASGGVCVMSKHVIKTWSSTQQVRAASSAEVEFYVFIKCACQRIC